VLAAANEPAESFAEPDVCHPGDVLDGLREFLEPLANRRRHLPSLLGETGAVLNDLLEFIKAQDLGHYEAMVQLVSPPVEEAAGA